MPSLYYVAFWQSCFALSNTRTRQGSWRYISVANTRVVVSLCYELIVIMKVNVLYSRGIVTYPLNNVVHPLNNWGLNTVHVEQRTVKMSTPLNQFYNFVAVVVYTCSPLVSLSTNA